MDFITKSSGLQHIAEQIFLNLNNEKLEVCQKVNEFWKDNLNSAMFWLKKCAQKGLTGQHYLEWSNLIKQPKSQNVEEQVISCLMKMYHVRSTSLSPILSPIQIAFLFQYDEIIEIMAPLTENPNTPFPNECTYAGYTPIQMAVNVKNVKVIRLLAPFSTNPNAPIRYQKGLCPIMGIHGCQSCNMQGWTPIQDLARYNDKNKSLYVSIADAEIIKILAPLSEIPNAP